MDIQLHDQGSLIGFQPVSAAGQEFLREQVHAEPWQYTGAILWVDQRMARDLMQGMIDNGLELGA